MEKILAFSAIICAFVFGLCYVWLDKRKFSQKPWNIVFKLFMQIIGIASYVCCFLSLSLGALDTPWWATAIISILPVAILTVCGCITLAWRDEFMQIAQNGFKSENKSFLRECIIFAAILIAGSVFISYFSIPAPIVLYPALILIMGGISCIIIGIVLLACFSILKLILYVLKNFKNIGKKYWKWLTN